MLKWFSNIPTSKRISWLFIFAYIIQVGFTMYALCKYQVDLTSVLTYTTPLLSIVVSAYFVKSGAENVTAIKQTGSQEGEI